MSEAGVDDLIDELFPEEAKKVPLPKHTAGPPQHGRRQSEWDDDSEEDTVAKTGVNAGGGGVSHPPAHSSPMTAANAASSATSCHSFDEDSSVDDGDCKGKASKGSNVNKKGVAVKDDHGRASAPIRGPSEGSPHRAPTLLCGVGCPVIHPVPFPPLADSEGSYSCAPRCYLTNRGATLRGDGSHPTLQQLRELAANERSIAGCTRAQAMLKKGAFHALLPKLGNGCLDHHGDCSNDGGCPHILCRKCNYMVVRLQGAEWDDDHGRVNLYLTLRNFYPDWCRLASATPVGAEDGHGPSSVLQHVLKVNPTAAAYCCQCSWLTVRSAKAVVETKLTDVFTVKLGADGSHPFATEVPLVTGEKRRPPLWVCHGHPQ
jgi:hypothetical protein